MEKRILKFIYNKSGAGNVTPRLTIPIIWTKDMGLTQESREVEVVYDEEKKEIIIRKKL
ncbi:AbrB/MazE/SpoVT family DNA-binding domain-containing protein [Peptostreptococcus porci]|uniref:AbrB/MazE/SpoVT family DNA-binding domain-containing protein n=1 Tax=Peptostreptococcus porci TaxID=2652282 RepID=UPI0023F1B919|nr:AbrB/MazE/SpoVT family DNA-binding domain-containing protein [Peptostreptococcus porci]MDD7182547.1 AbrB/MazE/SpoVT family DNA-binding domain-containing protein [Peptostreptococcus porci]MDY6232705.1 AbrB/MazE/SpoVT family DNA-binding domain-containing protein [Peptostreptococcus porci]